MTTQVYVSLGKAAVATRIDQLELMIGKQQELIKNLTPIIEQ